MAEGTANPLATPDGGPCPLCGAGSQQPFHHDGRRPYLRCGTCLLTWVPSACHLPPDAARARYALHRNDPSDPGYREFLGRLTRRLLPGLPAGAEGLDFGCGPGPVLAGILRDAGLRVRTWDPCFSPDPGPLRGTYDFITCTETLEHLGRPGVELARLDGMLRPGGVLGILTGILESDDRFPAWWYIRDLTHVAFYRVETLRWVGSWRTWELSIPAPGVVLFRKPGAVPALRPGAA